jgi:hypothetical protein
LRLANRFDTNDKVTLYLLCKTCRSGSVFRSDSILDGWRISDTKNYRISTSSRYSSNSYNGYNNSYYDDDYDLEIQRLRYSYDLDRNDAEVRLTTTVRNVGDRDVILDRLEYDIEVN